jgi:Ca-activated chloride channel family protein
MSAEFLFLRPWWLLGLLIVPALVVLQRSKRSTRNAWQRAVDPHLLPHLIEAGTSTRRSAWSSWLLSLGTVIAIVAMAGPSWQQQKAPLWQVEAPLVIALDLSSAMLATDLAPSRLVQARYKLRSLLKQRRGGQVGLIVYAGDAFTAAPITRDAGTVGAVIDSLTADLMPVDGQRADRAIESAVALMRSAGFNSGDILLVTDQADPSAQTAARQARSRGFHVSALGVGTVAGAPKTGPTGFISNALGQVEFARLDLASLTALAAKGGGNAVALSVDSADLQALDLLDPRGPTRRATRQDGTGTSDPAETVDRSDDGYWLLLLLLPLALMGFRRQTLMVLPLLLTAGGLMQPAPVEAATVSTPDNPARSSAPVASPSSAWAALWQRADQRARAALDAGDFQRARELAPDSALRAAAAYRSKDYPAAAKDFSAGNDADARYNLGNALAEAGQYEKAIEAYDEALARQPGMADALANRKAVEDALKQQRSSEDKQQGGAPQSQKEQGSPPSSSPDQKAGMGTPPPQNENSGSPSSASSASASGAPNSSAQPPAGSAGEDAAPEGMKAQQEKNQDGEAQQQADAAARRDMQRALAQQPANGSEARQPGATAAEPGPEQREETEHQQALQQWLRQVPDDPGGLLRRKFLLEYQRRQAAGERK